jgi:Zn-dependent protease with chaperone function
MLAVLPLMVFIFVLEMIHAIPFLSNTILIYPFIDWFISILLLLAMYLLTPFVLKYLWVTKPLPDGSLRIYLKSIAYRANIKIRDFLIWEVGRRPFVNALLIGIFPFNRFVIFTDSLIKNLSDDEITAVFSHEVGHAKFNHLLILLLFTVAYLSILFTLSSIFENALGNGIWNFGFSLSLIMVFWLVLFGQLSRRFELQADWYAAEITQDPDSFTRALTKIAYLNGIPMRTSGMSALTHPSIDKRITSIGNKSIFALSQLKTMKRIITILVISCGLSLGGIGYTIIKEINSAHQRRILIQAFDQAEQGRMMLFELEHKPYDSRSAEERRKTQAGVSYIEMAIAADPQEPYYYRILGNALEHLGPECHQTSQDYYRKAYELKPIYPSERYYLSKKLSN